MLVADQLMELLNNEELLLPDVIFLDVNLPDKNGYDCLLDIIETKRLDSVHIIMYSTSYQENVADVLFELGAKFYIKKPTEFNGVKSVIQKALRFVSDKASFLPSRANFLLA